MSTPSLDPMPKHAHFLTELDVRELRDGRKQLLSDLWFYSAEIANASGGSGILVIPAGTITNYASSPRLFWSLVPPDGPWRWAAVLHDAASQGDVLTEKRQRVHLVKHMTDRLFREAMTCPPCNEVPAWKRWLMYKAVVRYGTGAYGGPPLVDPKDAA
jgi:hypothetical protein